MAISTAAAILGAAGIGAVASSSASSKAAKAQSAAADQATAEQRRQFDLARGDQLDQLTQFRKDQAPWLATGTNAVNRLSLMLGLDDPNAPEVDKLALRAKLYDHGAGIADENALTAAVNAEAQRMTQAAKDAQASDPAYGSLMRPFSMQDFQQDPGYQFRVAEGEKALQRSAAARGGLLSGAALKAMGRYGQDMASQEYGAAYQRFNSDQDKKFNRLASLAGVGQTAATTTGSAGMTTAANIGNQGINTANAIGQNAIGAGNAHASGYVGEANAFTNALGQGANFYMQNRLLDRLSPQSYGVPQQPGVTGWASQG